MGWHLGAIEQALGVGREKLHSRVNTGKVTPFDLEVTRLSGPTTKHHRIEVFHQFFRRIGATDTSVGDKLNALSAQNVYPPLNDVFLVQFHVGNSVGEQTTNTISSF